MGLEHCALVVVITRLAVSQPRDGQIGGIGGTVNGAREPIWNPRGSLVVIVDHNGRGPSWMLLVLVHIVVIKAATTVAGDRGFLPQRP